MANNATTLNQLESHLWEAANILRGPVDAADFKTYVFPLLFFKRISDVHDEEYAASLAESGGDEEYALFPQNYRFQIPKSCHWGDVRVVTANVGQALQKAMRGIEKANPETLYGIFGDAAWTNKDRLPDSLLRDLLEHFSRISLGDDAAQTDILGQSYEYLIKKFADLTNKKAGEFYTPRSVVRLMVNILDPREGESIYDPGCGTGGMLLEATSKLLTGFDAPILQVMYLDKPMKDHNLLQAICRTNRTFGQEKTHGLIVDYIGIFDDVAQALDFDEKAVLQVVSNIDELRKELPAQVQKCLAFFPGVDRSVGGYEGLMAAQQALPNNEVRDRFAGEYSLLGKIWEAISPDPMLGAYEKDYRWLTQVYESVKPPSGNGKLLWHALGAKTVELINENVHVESVRDDVETLVMDAQVLEEILESADPAKKGKEIEIKLIARLRRHLGNPKFTALGERLEKIKDRHEQGFLTSLEFLKEMLELAKEVVEAEKGVDPVEERDRAKEALTELFNEAKNSNTHIIVERIVTDIDDIVKKVRFPEWQQTTQGERLVQKELRRTLLKYKLHTDQALFDKAYGYIRQYY